MAEIKIVDEQGNGVEPSEPKSMSDSPTSVSVPSGVFLVEQVGKLFDMRPNEISQNKRHLDRLIDYAKSKTDDHSPESIKWVIRRLGTKLGSPPLGERKITYLSRFAYLDLQSGQLDKEKKRFLNANKRD